MHQVFVCVVSDEERHDFAKFISPEAIWLYNPDTILFLGSSYGRSNGAHS